MRRGISQFDHRITTKLYQQPPQLKHLFDWITLLGHPFVVSFIAILISLFSLGLNENAIAQAFLIGLIALAIGSALKFVLRRPRPDTPYAQNMRQRTFSFPSGHAYGGGIIYGLITIIGFNILAEPWAIIVALGLIPLIILIGLSRIYLGAHYFLDVVGGWLLAIPVVYFIAEYLL